MGSTASSTYQDMIEGKLLVAITTGTTTGVTFKIKQINGVTPTCPTAAFRLKIVQKTATNNKVEKVQVAAGTTQSGQTVTLGTLTRGLPLSNGTDFTGSGTPQAFAAGADVFLSWDSHDAAQTAKLDIQNTFAAGQTISGTSSYLGLPSMTTTQRDALVSPQNGWMIYNSTTGVVNKYVGGAWTADSGTSVGNAANASSGKVDIASAAEIAAGTATDATSGAINVIPVSQTAKTSSGAGDENKLPVLDSVGNLATGFLPTVPVTKGGTGIVTATAYGPIIAGTTATGAFQATSPGTSGQIFTSNGASAAPTFQTSHFPETRLSPGVASATFGSSTTAETDSPSGHKYTIPANDWALGATYVVDVCATYHRNSTGDTATVRFYMGSVNINTFTFNNAGGTDSTFRIKCKFTCTSTGSGGTYSALTEIYSKDGSASQVNTLPMVPTTGSIDTTATQLIRVTAASNTNSANQTCTVNFINVTKLNAA